MSAIKRSPALAEMAGTEAARTIEGWAAAAETALNERGELMHSFASVTSDILDEDWIRMGEEPPISRVVSLTRLKGGARVRSKEDLFELADRLSGLADRLPSMHDTLRESTDKY